MTGIATGLLPPLCLAEERETEVDAERGRGENEEDNVPRGRGGRH